MSSSIFATSLFTMLHVAPESITIFTFVLAISTSTVSILSDMLNRNSSSELSLVSDVAAARHTLCTVFDSLLPRQTDAKCPILPHLKHFIPFDH